MVENIWLSVPLANFPWMTAETAVRFSAFLLAVFILCFIECVWPRRPLKQQKSKRWLNNFLLGVLSALLLPILLPILAVGLALEMEQHGWGLFNNLVWPIWLEAILGFALLELGIYWQHRLFHRLPIFWAMHGVHHTDIDLDLSSALRFHPFEIVISMLIKLALIALIGPMAVVVLVFEVVLNLAALLSHSNIYLPRSLDRWLRFFIVTPDMHRIHHSVLPDETDSNFGFFLSIWDRLFLTYRAEPKQGQIEMVLGLTGVSHQQAIKFRYLLALPYEKWQRLYRKRQKDKHQKRSSEDRE